MKYCSKCGHPLIFKYLKNEGKIPYCEICQEYRFPTFNSAVSMIVLNPAQDKILLIKQDGKDAYVLVAGYINIKENAIEAVKREVFEETGLHLHTITFNDSKYYEPTNTCMFNFSCVSDDMNFQLNEEVDEAHWFSFEDAKAVIKKNSLAEKFLLHFLNS